MATFCVLSANARKRISRRFRKEGFGDDDLRRIVAREGMAGEKFFEANCESRHSDAPFLEDTELYAGRGHQQGPRHAGHEKNTTCLHG